MGFHLCSKYFYSGASRRDIIGHDGEDREAGWGLCLSVDLPIKKRLLEDIRF